jgi:hypothetical protein
MSLQQSLFTQLPIPFIFPWYLLIAVLGITFENTQFLILFFDVLFTVLAFSILLLLQQYLVFSIYC